MSNELIWLLWMGLNFLALSLVFKFFGRIGLYFWIASAGVIANLQVAVQVEMFGLASTLGNIIYGTTFLATDVLSERYGRKSALEGVKVGFVMLCAFTAIMFVVPFFTLGENGEEFVKLYGILPRVALASFCAYLLSNIIDVYLFSCLREKFPRYWMLRNGATYVSQAVDTVVFSLIAFLGVFETSVVVEIILSTYLLKLITGLLDTPVFRLLTASKWFAKVREI